MKKVCVMTGMLLLTATLAVGSGMGQEKQKETPAVKGGIPPGWSKLGLTADQKKKVTAISSTYNTKIADLKAQIDQLKKDEYAEQVKVLTMEQVEQLKKLATEKIDKIDPPKIDDKKEDTKKKF